MKIIAALALPLILSACSIYQTAASEPSYAIQNPEIYATFQTLVDDDGISLSVPSTSDPHPWASGTRGLAD